MTPPPKLNHTPEAILGKGLDFTVYDDGDFVIKRPNRRYSPAEIQTLKKSIQHFNTIPNHFPVEFQEDGDSFFLRQQKLPEGAIPLSIKRVHDDPNIREQLKVIFKNNEEFIARTGFSYDFWGLEGTYQVWADQAKHHDQEWNTHKYELHDALLRFTIKFIQKFKEYGIIPKSIENRFPPEAWVWHGIPLENETTNKTDSPVINNIFILPDGRLILTDCGLFDTSTRRGKKAHQRDVSFFQSYGLMERASPSAAERIQRIYYTIRYRVQETITRNVHIPAYQDGTPVEEIEKQREQIQETLKTEELEMVDIHRMEHRAPKLKSEVRVLHLTDLHFGADAGTIPAIREIIEACKSGDQSPPDIIAITGDFVETDPQQLDEQSLNVLRELYEAFPGAKCYFTLGDHDARTFDQKYALHARTEIAEKIRHTGFTYLEGGSEVINIRGNTIVPFGITDQSTGNPQPPTLPSDESMQEATFIALTHNPDTPDRSWIETLKQKASPKQLALILTGHLHGGGGTVMIPGTNIEAFRGEHYLSALHYLRHYPDIFRRRNIQKAELIHPLTKTTLLISGHALEQREKLMGIKVPKGIIRHARRGAQFITLKPSE